MLYNLDQIKEIIPHREPFILIDEVLELEEGVSCVAKKYVKETDFWVPGHFPQEPVMPGVLQVEAIAQTGAVAILQQPENKGKIAYFAGLNKVKFKRKVVPGDELVFEVKIIRQKGPIGIGEGTAKVNGKLACSCELTFAIQ